MPRRWGQPLTLSTEQLVDVIRAAHRYQFHRVFDIALAPVRGQLDPVRALQLAMACDAPEWALEEFAAVVLGFEEIALQGTLAAKVWKARMRVAAQRQQHVLAARVCTPHLTALLKRVPTTRRERLVDAIPPQPPFSFGHHGLFGTTTLSSHGGQQSLFGSPLGPQTLFSPQHSLSTYGGQQSLFGLQQSMYGSPCPACANPCQQVLDKLVGPVEEEHRIIREIWNE